MKKIFTLAIVLFLLWQTSGWAFVYQLVIPDRTVLTRFSDEQLIDAYIDAMVEVEAANIFHQTSGFRPSDYEKHKALLRYRYDLLREIQKRKLQVPEAPPVTPTEVKPN